MLETLINVGYYRGATQIDAGVHSRSAFSIYNHICRLGNGRGSRRGLLCRYTLTFPPGLESPFGISAMPSFTSRRLSVMGNPYVLLFLKGFGYVLLQLIYYTIILL